MSPHDRRFRKTFLPGSTCNACRRLFLGSDERDGPLAEWVGSSWLVLTSELSGNWPHLGCLFLGQNWSGTSSGHRPWGGCPHTTGDFVKHSSQAPLAMRVGACSLGLDERDGPLVEWVGSSWLVLTSELSGNWPRLGCLFLGQHWSGTSLGHRRTLSKELPLRWVILSQSCTVRGRPWQTCTPW